MEFDCSKHKFQTMVLDCQKRFILCLAGAQGGKTTIGMVWFLLQIQADRERGHRGEYLVAVPEYKTWIQSTKVKFYEMYPKNWAAEGTKDPLGWHEKDGYFETVWGAKIYMRSVDDPNAIEGMTLDAAWLDEFGKMDEQVWVNIHARVLANKGRVIMTTTPYPENLGMLRKVYSLASEVNGISANKPADEIFADLAVVEWNTADNPKIDPEFIEAQRKIMSSGMFALRYKANLASPQGLVYGAFDKEEDVVDSFPIPDHWRRFGGIDFGFGSTTAIAVIAEKPPDLDQQGKPVGLPTFYLFREFYEKGASLSRVADFINRQDMRSILGDPRGAQEMHELSRAYGVRNLGKANNAVRAGIEKILVLIESHRFKIVRTCPHAIDEFTTYHHKPESDVKDSDGLPAKVRDHEVDAVRYAFSHDFHTIYAPHSRSVRYQSPSRPLARRSAMPAPDRYTGY